MVPISMAGVKYFVVQFASMSNVQHFCHARQPGQQLASRIRLITKIHITLIWIKKESFISFSASVKIRKEKEYYHNQKLNKPFSQIKSTKIYFLYSNTRFYTDEISSVVFLWSWRCHKNMCKNAQTPTHTHITGNSSRIVQIQQSPMKFTAMR